MLCVFGVRRSSKWQCHRSLGTKSTVYTRHPPIPTTILCTHVRVRVCKENKTSNLCTEPQSTLPCPRTISHRLHIDFRDFSSLERRMIPPLRIEKLFFLNFFFFNLKNFLQLSKNLKKKGKDNKNSNDNLEFKAITNNTRSIFLKIVKCREIESRFETNDKGILMFKVSVLVEPKVHTGNRLVCRLRTARVRNPKGTLVLSIRFSPRGNWY